jgi:outer membrane protein, heavy metal efflux system
VSLRACRRDPVLLLLGPLVLAACALGPLGARPLPRPLGVEYGSNPPLSGPDGDAEPTDALPRGVIDLDDALAAALRRSPGLAAFGWEVRASEARALQAGLVPNPESEIEVEDFGGTGSARGTQETETTLRIFQSLELGGKRAKRYGLAAAEYTLSGWDYEARRLDVISETRKAFVSVLAAQQRLALADELVALGEAVIASIEDRVRLGASSPVDVTRADVTLATSRLERERIAAELDVARLALAATWGETLASFERAEGALTAEPEPPSLEQLLPLAEQNPDLARWADEVRRREAAVGLEESKRIPDLTVGPGYRRIGDDNGFVVSLGVPLPLFDRNQGGIAEAHHLLAKAEQERRAAELRVRTDLGSAHRRASAAFQQAERLRAEILPRAEQALRESRESYQRGRFSYLEVLDAERTLFELREQSLEALEAYDAALAEIERLTGEAVSGAKP